MESRSKESLEQQEEAHAEKLAKEVTQLLSLRLYASECAAQVDIKVSQCLQKFNFRKLRMIFSVWTQLVREVFDPTTE